jgi:hypothetical protein
MVGAYSVGNPADEIERPVAAEFGSMPIDPVYAWGIVLEPVEILISETAAYILELSREAYERREMPDIEELEERFLAFFDRLVQEGVLARLPDADPAMGRRILGPRRWLRAIQARIRRTVALWQEKGGPDA